MYTFAHSKFNNIDTLMRDTQIVPNFGKFIAIPKKHIKYNPWSRRPTTTIGISSIVSENGQAKLKRYLKLGRLTFPFRDNWSIVPEHLTYWCIAHRDECMCIVQVQYAYIVKGDDLMRIGRSPNREDYVDKNRWHEFIFISAKCT